VTASDFRDTAADIAAALRAVPGVAAADVEPDDDGSGLGLLRLGLAPGVDEVKVATDVGRLLRERFGIGVDAERVQLVEDAETEFREEPAETPSNGYSRKRPAIQRMHLVSSGLDVTATVTLSYAGVSSPGEATGTATQSGVHRAVALATLHAVEEMLAVPTRFELEHIEVTPTGSERTVLVSITMLGRGGSERLTGAASVREDVRQAVIRATLDAVNRRLEPLLP
jgi:hypothetical protein